MQFDWNNLFPPGEPVIALPNWRRPRLLISAHRYDQRWRDSGFYLALRTRTRFYKQFLRLRAAIRAMPVRRAQGRGWILGEFLDGLVDSPQPPSIWIGTAGVAQKWTIRVHDASGKPAAYVKWGFTESARRRIVREHGTLCALPKGLGPNPLKVGPLAGGMALCVQPIVGRPLGRFTRPVSARLANFLEGLSIHTPLDIHEHSGFADLAKDAPAPVLAWIDQLADQSWPVVIRHGDLTPWNLIDLSSEDSDWGGRLAAVDWDNASMNGAPFLDVTHYHLQVAGLLLKRGPASATSFVVERLMRQPWPGLSQVHATAVTALAAYAAWRRAMEDGEGADEHRQRWHRTIWDRSPAARRATLTNLGVLSPLPTLASVVAHRSLDGGVE